MIAKFRGKKILIRRKKKKNEMKRRKTGKPPKANAATPAGRFFFIIIHYSHATYQIMARLCTVRFLSAVRAVAARCKLFHLSFDLPVSFRTSAHRIFCWAFHSGHTLKRCSRVWVGYRHHQHYGVGRFFVQLRYCPDKQCPVLSW